jgi:regulatory factor X
MSFSFDYDINASQQDPNHDDSGIGLLDERLDPKFSTSLQQSLKSHLSQPGLPQLPMGAH